MPKPLAATLSALFFLATATVLALPVVTSSAELVLTPQRFEGLVGVTSSTTPGSGELSATLDEGRADGLPWTVSISERRNAFCVSFQSGPNASVSAGLMCTEPPITETGPTQFVPASEDSSHGTLVAVLPGNIAEIQLRASDDLPFRGGLYEVPRNFKADAMVLVVFLPPGADVVSSTARTESGGRVDVSRLADQVNAY